ncbi:MAG: FAD-binding oxidoreductase [Candidatus Puniceispirillales bacterium]
MFGKRFTTNESILYRHGKDEAYHPVAPPDGVVFPKTTEEIRDIVLLCSSNKIPIVPFGVGTSLEGGIGALSGGICLDFSEMKNILEINQLDMDCRVQAGITRKELETNLKDTGLFFPVDPGADATIGGMAATSASGTNAVKYGTMRNNVMGLTVVMANGEIIKTGGRARKSSAGYDLTRLFVGSEGTLGIISEVTLKLFGNPQTISSAVCQFENLENAVNSVIDSLLSGVSLARIELLDEVQMQACINFSKLNEFNPKPTLFFEFHGTNSEVSEQTKIIQEITTEYGSSNFIWKNLPEERNRLWTARHNAYYASMSLKPGCMAWSSDVCVPITELSKCIMESKEKLISMNLLAPLVGHVGDGNFHLLYLIDKNDKEQLLKAKEHNKWMVEKAINLGGTCTGEHGVGYGKSEFLAKEAGSSIEVMKSIKNAFDPQGILNPGKIFL